MRSTSKVVLFSRTTAGKTSHTRPVGIFANTKTASAFRSVLTAAYATGSAEAVKALDAGVHLTEAGELHTDVKWALLEVPYEPEVTGGASEDSTFTL